MARAPLIIAARPAFSNNGGRVSTQGSDLGVVGAVGGLADGQGSFSERPGFGQLSCVLQDLGEVIQGDGDLGVVGAVGGLVDGQGPFGQRPGLGQSGMGVQVHCGAVKKPGSIGLGCVPTRAGEVIEVADRGQHVRQQHRPSGPRFWGARDLLRGISTQQAQHHSQPPGTVALC